MSKARNRIEWIDMAKGYGILLVILGHFDIGTLNVPICSFHMPLFFFLSGLTFSLKSSAKEFFQAKLKKLIVPYFCLCIPIIVTNALLYNGFTMQAILDDTKLFVLQQRYTPLWFLTSLIVLHFMYYAIIRYCNKLAGWIISILLALSGLVMWHHHVEPLVWNIDASLVVAPFFYAGYTMKSQIISFIQKSYAKHGLFIWLFVIICGAVTIILSFLNYKISGNIVNLFCCVNREEWLFYPTAFIGTMCIIQLSSCHTWRAISYIGRNSLIYFAWHQSIFLHLLVRVYSRMGIYLGKNDWNDIPLIVLTIIIIIILITIVNEIICRTKLKALLGK